ncbi:hypothetical protein L1887_28095 [Cichorium endivia]|nr:hypothetical protein L1887_28095 [Cichorium endivia]
MMKTAQKMLEEVEKCQKKIPELVEVVDVKLNSLLENMSAYLSGVLSENTSLRKTHFLLLQIITHTLQSITGTMEGPIQQIKVCTSLNTHVMEDFKEMASKPLTEDLSNLFSDVTAKLESILGRLPVPPSVPAGALGGG